MAASSNPNYAVRTEPYGTAAIAAAADIILRGGCVAMPTETVYGLAADATSARGVAAIYAAKKRPDFNPLIVHVADIAMARTLVAWSDMVDRLADAFWPGPLTLVLPRLPACPVTVAASAGLPTLAVRCPAHPAMRDLIVASGHPLAAPSANRSGAISPTSAAHVRASLGDAIPLIVDGGPCAIGLESTIIMPLADHVVILRPGPVTASAIAAICGLPVRVSQYTGAITAPGMMASHYSPQKPLFLNVTVPAPGQFHIGFGRISGDFNLSRAANLAEAAAQLFAALHIADASDCASIAVAPIPETGPENGMAAAIMDRLRRAAHP